jgi:nucleotidyltransferase/DNA polymerase involved in DNA repair
MKSVEPLNPTLQRLASELTKRFGPDIFQITHGESDHMFVENAENSRVSFSIVTNRQAEGCYSIIVYVPWPKGELGIGPNDHAVDRDNVSLEEVLEIFAKYKRYDEP